MRWLVLALSLLAAPGWASDEDLRSPACREALSALQMREAQLAAALAASAPEAADRPAAASTDATWRTLRAKAARICLGGAPDAPAPPPRGATSPAIGVPPVAGTPMPLPVPRAAPPPLPTRSLPPFVTLCDGTGCWLSDGERLPQVGRSPFDARVHCAVQGRVVFCQ